MKQPSKKYIVKLGMYPAHLEEDEVLIHSTITVYAENKGAAISKALTKAAKYSEYNREDFEYIKAIRVK